MEENKTDSKPRGLPKSGRFWKDQKSRFATVKKSPGLKSTFAEKQKFREDLKRIKALSRELQEQRKAAKEAKKERRRENIQRRKENEAKAEIVQVVNPAKLKKNKKSLKHVQKRDTLNMKT